MTAIFLATCGLACGFYLYVLVRLRKEKTRKRAKSSQPHLRVVEFRRPPVNERRARRMSA